MGKKKKNTKVVVALENSYTKDRYSDFQIQQKQLIFKRRRLTAILLISLVMFGVAGVKLMQDYSKLNSFQLQLKQEQANAEKIDEKLEKLEKEVALLNDEDYVAKLARYRFDMSQEGEQIYRIPSLDKAMNE